MVLAAAHVISATGLSFLISIYQPVAKRGYFLAALGALVPDFDFLLAIIFRDLGWHRAYLNYWFIPFTIFGLGYLVFPKYRQEVFLFSVGYLSHIILDFFDASLLVLGMIDGVVITGLVILLIYKYWNYEHKQVK